MATPVAAATKSYFVGPQDGWVEIAAGSTAINFIRMSGYPHTHPFQVGVGSSAPSAATPGITVCHHPFKVYDQVSGISSNFYVKVNNPSNQTPTGKLRIDVYCEGGVLQ